MTIEPTSMPSTPADDVAERERNHRDMLAQAVAKLEAGDVVAATFSPAYRGTYTVLGVLVEPELDDPGVLTLGGWERVRLATGLPPHYLRDLRIAHEGFVVTEPGVFWDMSEALYHSGPTPTPSLSYSGAKVLLQGPPARYRFQLDNRIHKAAWDFGHAWHSMILGKGDPVVEVAAKDWRTKAAQEARANAYDRGFVPLLSRDVAKVRAMAEVFLADPTVAPLFAADDGAAEVSMFGRDPVTGVWIRGRIDWVTASQRAFVDAKTTEDASTVGFNRTVERFGYAMQAAWYDDLAGQLPELPEVDRFIFAAQEKEPPFFPHVFELSADWLAIGRHLNRKALDLFAECVDADHWPAYGPGITTLEPPPWLLRQYADVLALDPDAVRDSIATTSGALSTEDEAAFEALLEGLTR